MRRCATGHVAIRFDEKAGKCPLCAALKKIREMEQVSEGSDGDGSKQ